LESPLLTKLATCRRRLVNAANPLLLRGRFIAAPSRGSPRRNQIIVVDVSSALADGRVAA